MPPSRARRRVKRLNNPNSTGAPQHHSTLIMSPTFAFATPLQTVAVHWPLVRPSIPRSSRPPPLPLPSPPRRREVPRARIDSPDVIIVGSGFGGLCAAAALTAYARRPLVLESHYAPGGCAHGFSSSSPAGQFHFDTGPSFFCGLSTARSLNPLKHALDAVGERVACRAYDEFVIDDLRVGSVRVSRHERVTLESVEAVAGRNAAEQLRRFYAECRRIHAAMDVPAIALRGGWQVFPQVMRRWAVSMLRLLPYVRDVREPISKILSRARVTDEFAVRVLDLEAFLLSGLKTGQTITAEIAFMVGEREKLGGMEYPVGGARAIIKALVRGIERKGGEVRCRSHVEEILVENGRAVGVRLRSGEEIFAEHVFSNASIWDTVNHLIPRAALPATYRAKALQTPVVESFMHAHMAFPTAGLPPGLVGHHAVIIDSSRDIAEPGNTVMISIPTVWSPELAPPGWHVVHAYTLEPYDRWPALQADRAAYDAAKRAAVQPLLAAVRHVVPDLDERLAHEHAVLKLGSPLTHARFNRRYMGTYGAAIDAGMDEFEWPGDIPIANLKRCSDSTFPGIGVPSAAAAGLIAANELVGAAEHAQLVDRVFPRRFDE